MVDFSHGLASTYFHNEPGHIHHLKRYTKFQTTLGFVSRKQSPFKDLIAVELPEYQDERVVQNTHNQINAHKRHNAMQSILFEIALHVRSNLFAPHLDQHALKLEQITRRCCHLG